MKEKLTNNISFKIASVVISILVWITVLNINDPDKSVSISNIPVKIINDEAITSLGKSYSVESGETCTITIEGPRSIVDQLDEDDFVATADVNDLSLTNSVPIVVELEKAAYKSKIDITVESNLRLAIEDIIEKEFEIIVNYAGEEAKNYVATETHLETPTVVVSAPESDMDKIKSVVTTINVANKEDDFSATTEIRLLDGDGRTVSKNGKDIKVSFNEVNSVTTVLMKKDLDIVCTLPEAIDEDNIIADYELSDDTITVLGRKDKLDSLDIVELPVVLEGLEEIEDAIVLTYSVEKLLPDEVLNDTNIEEITLTIYIDKQGERVITTKAKNVSISDIPEDMEASLVTKGDISYTIRGLKVLIDELDAEEIELKVEIGALSEGTHRLKVEFKLPEGIEVVESVYVEVSLALKDDGSEETSDNTSQEATEEDSSSQDSSTSDSETEGESGEGGTSEEETTTPMGDESEGE